MTVSVILPTYNERETIVRLISGIRAAVPQAEVVVVDDDSPDQTWGVVTASFPHDPHVRLLRRVGRRGLPSALAEGLALAKGEALVWLDADGSMPPVVIPQLLAQVDAADVVVASRYAPGGQDARTSSLRIFTSWLINRVAALLLGGEIRDYTSGFVTVRRHVLDRVPLRTHYVYGDYCIDFLYRAQRAGFRVREVPFRCVEREAGQTKTAPDLRRFVRLGWAYLQTIFRLRWGAG